MSIYTKINQVMKAVRGVEKTRTNAHGKFKYAGHEDVNEALRGQFAALGIVRTARMNNCQVLEGGTLLCQCEVSYTDIEDGSFVCVPMWAVQPSQTSGKTVTAQQVGQALSYATKNVEFKLFALTGDNEADSDSTDAYNPHERPSSAPPPGKSPQQERAEELLKMFSAASSLKEAEEVNGMFKREWNDLKGIKGLAEAVVAQRKNAIDRIAKLEQTQA